MSLNLYILRAIGIAHVVHSPYFLVQIFIMLGRVPTCYYIYINTIYTVSLRLLNHALGSFNMGSVNMHVGGKNINQLFMYTHTTAFFPITMHVRHFILYRVGLGDARWRCRSSSPSDFNPRPPVSSLWGVP